MKVVALIPARGGSKSIPRKNIRLFNGIPLIAYSIAAAIQSKKIDRVICSTDDAEIAEIANKYGAETPFIRPGDLSGDDVMDYPVFEHALAFLLNADERPDMFIHLRPTSPFRPPHLIDNAIEMLNENPEADSLRSISEASENPYKMWHLGDTYIKPIINSELREAYNHPRQDLPESYWHNGVLDIVKTSCLEKKNSISGDNILPLITLSEYSIDLDDEWQWEVAENHVKNTTLPYIKVNKIF